MPSAPWRRAPAPRAGGGRAAFRFGWGGGGSRRRQAHEQGPAACGALGDAALPRWARGAAGVRVRRCLPCGQRRCRVARRIMACRGKKAGFRNVSPIRGLSRRAGGRGNGLLPARSGVFPARRNPYALTMSLSPQETEIRPISQSEHPLFPAKPSTFIYPWQTRPFSSRVSSPPAFRGEHPARPSPAFHAHKRPSLRPSRHRLIPQTIPPGERRALPAPAQGSKPLRIPFWGAAAVSPHPRPPTPQAASPCSWTCRRVRALPPDRNETKQDRPLLVGRACVTHAPKAPAAGTAGSARTRSRVQTLENPFLGSGSRFPAAPIPQNAAGGRPLLVGLPQSIPTTAPFGTKRSKTAPCSWGGRASNPSQRHRLPAPPARRRQVPARGLAAVYALCCRTETKRSKTAPCSWGGLA